MSEILKERIKSRMEALGKNPSSVALEAKLGRSAVRDILSGKAKNPSYMTLHRIADALDCSVNYLTGDQDEIYWQEATDILIDLQARHSDVSGVLEAGVFRQLPESLGLRERHPLRSKRRYLGRDLYLYRMGDDSLEELHIRKGDFLTVVHDPSPAWLSLKPDMLVVVCYRPKGLPAEQLSARLVSGSGAQINLNTAAGWQNFPSIVLTKKLDEKNHYETEDGGIAEIEGVVVNLTRQFDM